MLIEQYLPNISDLVYSVHQSFMWFLWLNWRKSTYHPVTAPNDSKCWPIVTSSIQEPAASNCDVTVTDCSRVVAMEAFLAQWCWGHLFNEFVKDTSVPSCNFFVYFFFNFVTPPVFQHGATLVHLILTYIIILNPLSIIRHDYHHSYYRHHYNLLHLRLHHHQYYRC